MKEKTLLDPKIFISAFSQNQKALAFLLQTTISAYHPFFPFPLTISDVKVYEGGSIRSDGSPDQSVIVFAEDANGHLYDFDLVIADEACFTTQAHTHSSHLALCGRHADNKDVECYVFLFTPKTLPGCDLPLAILKWSLIETDVALENADHVLLINCERDTKTLSRFHDMIHDLRQHDPDEMYTSELRKAFLEALE